MATDTWMPLYIADYLADTRRLTLLQHGAYLLLLMEYWRLGPLPDDDKQLANIVQADQKTWTKEIGPAVRRFFTLGDDGLLHQKRIDKERARAAEISSKRRVAAMQRGNKPSPYDQQEGSNTGAIAPAIAGAIAISNDPANVDQLDTHALVARPLQKKDPSSLRSEAPSDGRLPLDEPIPPDPAASLFKEGLETLAKLAGKPPNALRSFVGQCRSRLRDDAALLDLIGQADRQQIVEPVSWLRAAVIARTQPKPPPDANDAWGLSAWIGRQNITTTSIGADGKPHPAINGYFVEGVAEDVALAADLPVSWRGNWDALATWLRDDINIGPDALQAISSVARRVNGDVSSMALFDSAVRGLGLRVVAGREYG